MHIRWNSHLCVAKIYIIQIGLKNSINVRAQFPTLCFSEDINFGRDFCISFGI